MIKKDYGEIPTYDTRAEAQEEANRNKRYMQNYKSKAMQR